MTFRSVRSLLPLLTAAALLAGCDAASLAGAKAGNGQPTTAGSPASGSSAFIAGRKWDYAMSVKSAAMTTTGTTSIEISDVKDGKATAKVTTSLPPAPAITATNTFDVNDKQAFSKASGGKDDSTLTVVSTGNESVTVPAGTFTCVKTVYKSTANNAEMEMTQWVDEKIGLIKSVSTVKPTIAMPQLPSGVSLPGGAALDLSSTTTLQLTSYK